MIIDPAFATAFISAYTKLMIEVCGPTKSSKKRSVLKVLAEGRTKCLADRSLITVARSALEARGENLDSNACSAVESMQVKRWIFLRDMKRYSVFVDPSGTAAYGVLGLTEPIRNIIGGSGAVFETAVLRYRGRFVCDGLITGTVLWLGPNYRRDYGALLKQLKVDGRFVTNYEF
jgi:hypothetical protein